MMEYEFYRDENGRLMSHFSMEHQVIGYWLNEEIKGDIQSLKQIRQLLEKNKNVNIQCIEGHEYSLFFNHQEITIKSNHVEENSDIELEQGLHYYESESEASCGLTDFFRLIDAYSDFCINGC